MTHIDLGERPLHIRASVHWPTDDTPEPSERVRAAVAALVEPAAVDDPVPPPPPAPAAKPDLPALQHPVDPRKVAYQPVEVLNGRLSAELQEILMTQENLARDIAYFGQTRLPEIMKAYNLDEDGLNDLLEDSRFQAMVHQFSNDVAKDVRGTLRARANMMLNAQLEVAHEIAFDRSEKASDRLKAINLTAQLADALPMAGGKSSGTGDFTGTGVNVTFNFGNLHPHQIGLREVIVGEAARGDD